MPDAARQSSPGKTATIRAAVEKVNGQKPSRPAAVIELLHDAGRKRPAIAVDRTSARRKVPAGSSRRS